MTFWNIGGVLEDNYSPPRFQFSVKLANSLLPKSLHLSLQDVLNDRTFKLIQLSSRILASSDKTAPQMTIRLSRSPTSHLSNRMSK